MRNLKRLLTMFMAIAMMMSLMVVGAGATSFKDDKDIAHKDAVEKMVSLNIINGRDDGNYDPNGIVTRAEMAKMICVALNGGVDNKLSPNSVVTASFTDTKGHWAEGYIEYCVNMGIAAGLGDKTFGPDQKVTPTQAAKMLLVALGYDAAYEKFTGATWAINTNKVAMQKGLYDDIQGIDPNAPMTRDSAAQMIFNFCDANMVKYEFGISGSTGGAVTGVKQAVDSKILVNGKEKYETILNKYYKLNDDTKGIMTDWSYDKDKKEYKYTIKDASATFTAKKDYTAFFGQNVQVLFKDKNNDAKFDSNNDEVYDIAAKDSKVVLSGLIGDMDEVKTGDREFKYDSVTYKLSDDAEKVLAYNAGVWAQAKAQDKTDLTLVNISKAKNSELAHFNFAVIDNTGDDKGDIVVVYPYTVEKITYVDSKGASTNNATYKFDDCEIYKDVAKNDWAKIVGEANATLDRDTLTKVTAITGEITSIKNSNKIVVDGKTYINAAGVTGDTNYKVGDKMELITLNGYIFNAKKVANSVSKEKLLLVIEADAIGTGTDAGKQQIKVLFADGTKRVVKTDKIDDNDVSGTNKFDVRNGAVGQYRLETIYTYGIDKDGNYELDSIGPNDYDKTKAVSAAASLDTGKLADTGYTARFADDAVIFYNTGSEFKATTGKNVNTWAKYNVGDIKGGTLYANETDGFLYTQVGFLDLKAAPTDKDSKYGYIVADPELVKVGDDYYYQLKVWNGTENIIVKAESTGANGSDVSNSASVMAKDINVMKGTAITYKVSGDGIVEKVTTLAGSINAIKAYTDGKSYVGMQSAVEYSAGKFTSTDLKLTSDSVIVRFSSEDKEGQAGTGITVAKESKTPGIYQNNCYVVANSDNEIEALIIDKDSNLGMPAAAPTAVSLAIADTNAATIKAADLKEGAGSVTGLMAGKNSVKVVVTDAADTTSTVTINGADYKSGDDYTIAKAGTYTVFVVTERTGYATTTSTYTFNVEAAAPAPKTLTLAGSGDNAATVVLDNLLTGAGSVTGWVKDSKDTVKLTVDGSATYTIKINTVAYTAGENYVIATAVADPGTTYNVVVTATANGFTTTTYNYSFTAMTP